MRYLSLFSGIGAFEKALSRIGVDYELVGFSEIDKYAIKSYCAVHGVDESLNLGDISKIDLDKLPSDIDLITHGSPCQDFSIAGKLAGGDKGSGTRSSLMWCTVDIVERARPKYVIWENVKNVLSAKNRHNFDGYLRIMDEMGYNSYYQVLNAKNYGIPQNRERVFTVSIRKDLDIDFKFPEGFELKLKLKDMLEEKVDEKYYLSDKFIQGLLKHNEHHEEKGTGFIWKPRDLDGVASTLRANGALAPTDNTIEVVGNLDIKGHDCVKRVYGVDGISPTLTDMQGGNRQPKIVVDEPVIAASRGRNPENPSDRTPGIPTEQRLEINKSGVSNTITTVQKDNYVIEPCLKIKEATKTGYKEAYEGDGVNISGRMKWQRGNVQKDSIQTLVTSGNERGVVVAEKDIDNPLKDKSPYGWHFEQNVYSEDSKCCRSVKAGGGSGNIPKVIEDINKSAKHQQDLVQGSDDICRTIPAGTHGSTPHLLKTVVDECPLRIRKLTPRECWRLMGFDDEDFDKAEAVPTSNTQLYKQAGNSIVVNVLEAIFKNLFVVKKKKSWYI